MFRVKLASRRTRRSKAAGAQNQPDKTGAEHKDSSVFKVLERVSVAVGLLVLVPITHIWDRAWWVRTLFVISAGALLAATTFDLLPRWSRRWPIVLGFFATLAGAAALGPDVLRGMDHPVADTAGWATIVSPRNGQVIALTVREASGYTDGFTASGRCAVPPGYRAVIGSLADDGSGYWLLSDGILPDCLDDGAAHPWTATKVDPTWSGMPPNRPVTLGVIILRKDLAEHAQVQKLKGDPIKLPQPAASAHIHVSRVQQH